MKRKLSATWGQSLAAVLFVCVLMAHMGCEPVPPGDNETDSARTWTGTEEVTVTFGADEAIVCLEGLPVSTYEGADGVRLSDVIIAAALVEKPEGYFFNFIATDGFDMSKMAIKNERGLPTWEEMQRGYLYDGGSAEGLTIRWEAGTGPGDFGRFYKVKFMNNGLVQICEDDVL